MSYFKKLTKEFNEIKTTFTDTNKAGEKPKYSAAPLLPSVNTKPPPSQIHNSPPPITPSYPPQQQQIQPSFSAPYPTTITPHVPQDGPTCPPGWIARFDPQSQRWYFVNLATGQTQWDMPGYNVQSVTRDHAPHHPTFEGYGDGGNPRAFDGQQGYGYGAAHHGYGGQGQVMGQAQGQHSTQSQHTGQWQHTGQGQYGGQAQYPAQAGQQSKQAQHSGKPLPQKSGKVGKSVLKGAAGIAVVGALIGGLLGVEMGGDGDVEDTDAIASDYQPAETTTYTPVTESGDMFAQQNHSMSIQGSIG